MGALLQSQGVDGHQGGSGHGGPPELSDIDSDGDGAISQTEMEAFDTSKSGRTDTTRADEMFAAMDTDGDGSVTSTEKSAFDDQMAANGPQGGPPPGPPPGGMGNATSTSSASSLFSSSDSASDIASLLKELQGAIDSYSQTSLQSMASASASSLSVAA